MSRGEQIVGLGYYSPGIPALERAEHIDDLFDQIVETDMFEVPDRKIVSVIKDKIVATSVFITEAMLLNDTLSDYYENTWLNCQALSRDLTKLDSQHMPIDIANRIEGVSTEAALHNLLWWGIARTGVGRYARLTTNAEDNSDLYGRKTGFDLVFRSNGRRWKIQAKRAGNPDEIKGQYTDEIIVLTPEMLYRLQGTSALDIHQDIADENTEALSFAWHNFLNELRTQKAPNGVRSVI